MNVIFFFVAAFSFVTGAAFMYTLLQNRMMTHDLKQSEALKDAQIEVARLRAQVAGTIGR